MELLRGKFLARLRAKKIAGAPSLCDLASNIDDFAEISRFFELLSAQVSYPGIRIPQVVPVL